MSEPTARPSRRNFVALGASALVVAALPMAARRTKRRPHQRTMPVMGTIADLTVIHDDPARAQAAMDAAVRELSRIEQLMSRYNPASDVGRVNSSAAHTPVPVSLDTATVVLAALDWAAVTDGRFDPALQRVTSLWNVEERRTPPAVAEYRRFAGRRLFEALEVSTVRGQPVILRRDTDVGIDLGAIAKGYAIDRAGEQLRAHGVRDGIVRVGGDLVALGSPLDDEAWRIGIRSPRSASELIGEVVASDAAIATSGDYQRYFDYDGVRYHHLMDPATAAPRRTPMHSLTVRAVTCMHADAAATSCYGMSSGLAGAVLASRPSQPVVVKSA